MNDIITVTYKYSHPSINDDLVCELTEFFDTYIHKNQRSYTWYKTYLYNDLSVYTDTVSIHEPQQHQKTYMIPFRVPGATRGGLLLTKVAEHQYKIESIDFITETSFSEKFGCYDDALLLDSKRYIGRVLDFSQVTLMG